MQTREIRRASERYRRRGITLPMFPSKILATEFEPIAGRHSSITSITSHTSLRACCFFFTLDFCFNFYFSSYRSSFGNSAPDAARGEREIDMRAVGMTTVRKKIRWTVENTGNLAFSDILDILCIRESLDS